MTTQLRALGYELQVVGSLHEYLETGADLREHVVLISETFDASAQESIAHWVRYSARPTKLIFLYTHHIDRVRGADGIADARHLDNLLDALSFVRLDMPELAVA
jgi:hypothetical protein